VIKEKLYVKLETIQIQLVNFKTIQIQLLNISWNIIRDVKKIRIRGYPQITSATGRKQILKMYTRYCEYGYFWYPHVNGAGTGIIISVPVDIRTR